MTEPTLPAAWSELLIEQRRAKIRQAAAFEEQAKALRQEAETLAKMAKIEYKIDAKPASTNQFVTCEMCKNRVAKTTPRKVSSLGGVRTKDLQVCDDCIHDHAALLANIDTKPTDVV